MTQKATNSTIPSTSPSVQLAASDEGPVGSRNPTIRQMNPTATKPQAASAQFCIVFQVSLMVFSIVATSPFTSSSMDVSNSSLSNRRLCTSG